MKHLQRLQRLGAPYTEGNSSHSEHMEHDFSNSLYIYKKNMHIRVFL